MPVYPILSLDLKLTPDPWDFALAARERIAAYWLQVISETSGLWNGEVLMCTKAELSGTTLAARFIKTDFASLIAWRDWGWPETDSLNCFGSAAVLSADGALLYGRMATHTVNAGRVYPPGGSLEPADVTSDGNVDVLGSIVRELAEETGLDLSDAEEEGYVAVFDDRQRVAIAQVLRFPDSAADLERRVSSFLAGESKPELAGVTMLRCRSQVNDAMPGFAQELAHYLLPD